MCDESGAAMLSPEAGGYAFLVISVKHTTYRIDWQWL